MWETCSVHLEVRLPPDVAAAAAEVQKTDPDFLSRVVTYGLTRRAIFEQLRAGAGSSLPADHPASPATTKNP